jgi:hypothetical protein
MSEALPPWRLRPSGDPLPPVFGSRKEREKSSIERRAGSGLAMGILPEPHQMDRRGELERS